MDKSRWYAWQNQKYFKNLKMISYAKALRLIEKIPIHLKNENISTINSINRVSAENVISPNNNPLSNNAAFDGFAILSKETKNLSKKKS